MKCHDAVSTALFLCLVVSSLHAQSPALKADLPSGKGGPRATLPDTGTAWRPRAEAGATTTTTKRKTIPVSNQTRPGASLPSVTLRSDDGTAETVRYENSWRGGYAAATDVKGRLPELVEATPEFSRGYVTGTAMQLESVLTAIGTAVEAVSATRN